jgi:hypothetical protein
MMLTITLNRTAVNMALSNVHTSTATNFATFLDYITPPVHSQRQTDAIFISGVHMT